MIKPVSSKPTEIHYWGHSSYSVFDRGFHLLMDPVFNEPFEEGSTFFNPSREIDIDKTPPADIIYISHNHGDHFDKFTLKYFLKDKPLVLCPEDSYILNKLKSWGFGKIKTLQAEELMCFGPWTLQTTPSMSPFNELGLMIAGPDIKIWNQVDTSVDLKTIWKIKNKYGKIDILFCPFQPFREYCYYWPKETGFPQKRLENLIKKALAVPSRYVIPSSCSIRAGHDWEWVNSRVFPLSKDQFIQQIQVENPSVQVYDIEAGSTLKIDDKKMNVETSSFIKRTGKRINFHHQSHPAPPPLNSQVLSEEDQDKIIRNLKNLPLFLSQLMSKKFIHCLECIKADNYTVVLEIMAQPKNLSFVLSHGLTKINQSAPGENWDYWFQYGSGDLLKKQKEPYRYLLFYAYRNVSPNKSRKSPLSLYGYNEEHAVDGYEADPFLCYYPFLPEQLK